MCSNTTTQNTTNGNKISPQIVKYLELFGRTTRSAAETRVYKYYSLASVYIFDDLWVLLFYFVHLNANHFPKEIQETNVFLNNFQISISCDYPSAVQILKIHLRMVPKWLPSYESKSFLRNWVSQNIKTLSHLMVQWPT